MKNVKWAAILLGTMASAVALADDIYLGDPIYGGDGCPRGTASAVLSPDHKTVSILFDQYQVEAGRTSGKTVDRKGCNIAVPVHVPQGLSLSIFQVDYRGFNSLPAGAMSRLNVEYFFAGQSAGPVAAKTFFGPQLSNYLTTDRIGAAATVWSECGRDTNLRINSNMLVRTNGAFEQAFATVDSADIKSGLIYHLQTMPCR